MTLIDWLISLGLIYAVVRQLRPRRLGLIGITWPVLLVAWAAVEYLGLIPGYWSDWALTLGLASLGAALGTGSGLLTRVYPHGVDVMARATGWAALLWIVGMVSRIVFGLVAINGGAEAIGRLSMRMDLHSEATWPTALIGMALTEVVVRTLILLVRYRRALVMVGDRFGSSRSARATSTGAPVSDLAIRQKRQKR